MIGKLVYGVGVNDKSKPSRVDKKLLKEYALWYSMLHRCFSREFQASYPTYIGCSVSDNFKNYSYFYEWCQTQTGFGKKGWQLDKDILVKGNKLYSEETCVFVPRSVNLFFVDRGLDRGEYPLGVCIDKRDGKYIASCNGNGRRSSLGYFGTPEEAFQAYKIFKESLCKELALKWRCEIDARLFDAMMVWSVNYE